MRTFNYGQIRIRETSVFTDNSDTDGRLRCAQSIGSISDRRPSRQVGLRPLQKSDARVMDVTKKLNLHRSSQLQGLKNIVAKLLLKEEQRNSINVRHIMYTNNVLKN